MRTLAIIHSTIRAEEKLLMKAAEKRGFRVVLVDVRDEILNPQSFTKQFDVALERCVSTVKGNYAVSFLEVIGIPVINTSSVATLCEDKFKTSLALLKNNVPTPKFALTFTIEQAIQAAAEIGGYPIVVKPSLGSWGRLIAKVNDQDSLEALVEHKDTLGSPQQKAIYMQEYIKKPERDIRVFVINGSAICAIYRTSKHWITNTARGAIATNCPLTEELKTLAKNASDAVGGGILAMDIFESNDGLSINEINHTMEFKNSEEPTGVSISGAIIDYCWEVANG